MENSFRDRFVVDEPGRVYLDGNSLGRLPRTTPGRVDELVRQEWGVQLIGGWNGGWLELPRRLGDKIGEVIGAAAGETIVCDSTTVNLFKLATALCRSAPGRTKIISDRSNFPSDLHILSRVAGDTAGGELQLLDLDEENPDGVQEKLSRALDDRTALVSLSHVQYKTGRLFDLPRVTRLVQSRGGKMLWDLSHSAGALPINFSDSGADAAVGCTYKFLNGGPGGPAFLSLRKGLITELENPIPGWWGTAEPFDFSRDYRPHPGIERWTVGTPPILSLAALEPGIDLVLEAGIEFLRRRSLELGDQFMQAFDQRLATLGYRLLTPREADRRGSQVSIRHPHAWQITQDLLHHHAVVPDFRQPDVIRLGLTPLYTTSAEIEKGVAALEASVRQQSYRSFSPGTNGVT